MFPGLDLHFPDPAQPPTTAGEEVDHLDHDLSQVWDIENDGMDEKLAREKRQDDAACGMPKGRTPSKNLFFQLYRDFVSQWCLLVASRQLHNTRQQQCLCLVGCQPVE